MDNLTELENQSIFVLREAYKNFKNLTMLWSIDINSAAMLRVAQKAFYGHIPIPLLNIGTINENPGGKEYIDHVSKYWHLNLVAEGNMEDFTGNTNTEMGRRIFCEALKTHCLANSMKENNFSGLILGMLRVEERTSTNEQFFSTREKKLEWKFKFQPPEHWRQFKTSFSDGTQIRIHPLLNWTELAVREYLEREMMPIEVVDRYFS